jgi:regulator of protease activity HflC (stomatin/prohibitin superfamily)
MVWLVLTVIFVVIGAIGLFVFVAAAKGTDGRFGGAITVILALLAEVVLTLASSFALLGTGQVGLVYNFAGKLTGVKTQPGLIAKAPWTSIVKESVQIQREDFVLGAENSAVTNDQQEITANLAINYEVDPQHVFTLYKNVGPSWKQKLVDSRVLQDFKEVTATYHTIDITNHREQLRRDTLARLKQELAPYSITVTDFFIQNIGFSQAYQNAITAKQVQVQKAQQAQAKVAQAHAEAQQAIQFAEGQAASISLVGHALQNFPEVLKLRALEHLSPKAEVIYCANASCPAFLGTLGDSAAKK